MKLRTDIENILQRKIENWSRLSGGCVGDVFRIFLEGGDCLVVKEADVSSKLSIEGEMLIYLAEHSDLSVPEVFHHDDRLLIMSYLDNDARPVSLTQIEIADQVVGLHRVHADEFGLPFDTLIGGVRQPNDPCASWLTFFSDRRLRYMCAQCITYGHLDERFRDRMENLINILPNVIDEPKAPSLLHGDLWGGNILCSNGHLTGFVDPAIYYGHPEMDLAFSTLFNSLGKPFFGRYQKQVVMEPGFWEERRDLYNLYPLLVHARLFGGSYVSDVDRVLKKFGC